MALGMSLLVAQLVHHFVQIKMSLLLDRLSLYFVYSYHQTTFQTKMKTDAVKS